MSAHSDDPSPLPSPIFARCSPSRGTIARKCRDFYLRRLERTAKMQKRWSFCESDEAYQSEVANNDAESSSFDQVKTDSAEEATLSASVSHGESYPLRKCRSSFDFAMDSLRKEISALIAQDNDLFCQLLSLHDSIAELRERQRSCHRLYLSEDEVQDEDLRTDSDFKKGNNHSLSLDSLSDSGDHPETSPDSTLSSRSSLSDSATTRKRVQSRFRLLPFSNRHRPSRTIEQSKKRSRMTVCSSDDSTPLIFIGKTDMCFRCQKMAPPYRRARSASNLYWLQDDTESYDSGIHLQGCHSDSDHEIFV